MEHFKNKFSLISAILLLSLSCREACAEFTYSKTQPYDRVAKDAYVIAQNDFDRGQITKTNSHFRKALANVDKVIAIEKNFVPAHMLRGAILEFGTDGHRFTKGANLSEAEKCYRRVLLINKDYPMAYHAIGVLKYREGDTKKAIEYLEKAITLYKGMGVSYNALGDIYFDQGRYKIAMDYFYESMQRNPVNPACKTNMAKAVLRIMQTLDADRKAGALRIMRRLLNNALLFNPDYVDAYYWFAVYHAERGNQGPAIEYLQTALKAEPNRYRENAKKEPSFAALRANPDFKKIMDKYQPLSIEELKKKGALERKLESLADENNSEKIVPKPIKIKRSPLIEQDLKSATAEKSSDGDMEFLRHLVSDGWAKRNAGRNEIASTGNPIIDRNKKITKEDIYKLLSSPMTPDKPRTAQASREKSEEGVDSGHQLAREKPEEGADLPKPNPENTVPEGTQKQRDKSEEGTE